MSINNKLIIAVSALAIIIIVCVSIFSVDEPKASYEGLAATPIAEYKININTADAAELTRCNGLGEKTAEAIIEYREQIGRYEKVEDLMNIKGIGEKKLSKWIDMICVN